MTGQAAAQIIIHDAPGEFRAAACDADGRPFRLFSQRWGGADSALRYGTFNTVRLRRFAIEQGGAFVQTGQGVEAFLPLKDKDGLTEGCAITVRTVAEARRGKLARVQRCKSDHLETQKPVFELWKSSLPNSTSQDLIEDAGRVHAAFEEALAPSVTLKNGGKLHIERTRALTAFDIDTAGRMGKGSAGARARAIGIEAAQEAARQMSLRGLGGALVLDCLSPLNKSSREAIRDAFTERFQAINPARVSALAPSKYELMEASVAWYVCPVEDQTLDETGQPTAETQLLSLLCDLERELLSNAAGLFTLYLSEQLYAAYLQNQAICDHVLKARFGGRATIQRSLSEQSEVKRR